MQPLTRIKGGLCLRLRVQPRSSRDRVVGLHGQWIKLQVTAPPVDGAANAAVAKVLAAWLDVPRSAVTIVKGQGSRDKVVEIASADPEALLGRIENALLGRADR